MVPIARLSRYVLPRGIRRLWKPAFSELKLFVRTWLNVLLPQRLVRYRRILRQPDKHIHVGCGSKLFPGWINVDMNPKGDFTADLREGLPFRTNDVELIYTEHALEHFYREHDAPFLLRECLRVLKPGGWIRITVPDAQIFLDYYQGKLEPQTAELLGKKHHCFNGTRLDAVNSGFRWKHQHHYMYDEETLRALLEEIGFDEIERRRFRSSPIEAFRNLDLETREIETLYMEARKPAP